MTLRRIAVMLVLTIMNPGVAWATDLKPINAQRAKDITVTLLSETGQWKPGSNSFVLQFTSADKKAADVGKVALSTSMPMPGMAPMVAARLSGMARPEKARPASPFRCARRLR